MLSKIVQNHVFWRSTGLQKTLPAYFVRSTSGVVTDFKEHKEKMRALLKEELPKPYDGPERDLVNYPRLPRPINPGKVRLAIFPDEWFTFFYKKTGVTGPYVFGTGLLTFLLSKELYVIEEELSTGCAMFILIWLAIKYAGPHVSKWADTEVSKKSQANIDMKTANMKQLEDAIEGEKKAQWQAGVAETLIVAKRENVMMQLETEYRRRLMTVYEQVKKRLDYHLDIDNTRRNLEQKHMVNWIVSSVVKSITPQQEKEALQKCVADLKALSARA